MAGAIALSVIIDRDQVKWREQVIRSNWDLEIDGNQSVSPRSPRQGSEYVCGRDTDHLACFDLGHSLLGQRHPLRSRVGVVLPIKGMQQELRQLGPSFNR